MSGVNAIDPLIQGGAPRQDRADIYTFRAGAYAFRTVHQAQAVQVEYRLSRKEITALLRDYRTLFEMAGYKLEALEKWNPQFKKYEVKSKNARAKRAKQANHRLRSNYFFDVIEDMVKRVNTVPHNRGLIAFERTYSSADAALSAIQRRQTRQLAEIRKYERAIVMDV